MGNVAVIGAGPIGCYVGALLAKKGYDTTIYEEDTEIGIPMQCTGIVTKELFKIFKPKKEIILNKLTKIKLYSSNRTIELPIEEYVLDRTLFDKSLAELAKKNGCQILLKHKLVELENNTLKFKCDEKLISKNHDFIIGADGPNSTVANCSGLWTKPRFYHGIQARVQWPSDGSTYHVYLGSKFPGFFGWIVPENNKIARIGIAAKYNAKAVFEDFIKDKIVANSQILEKTSGLIPLFDPQQKIQSKHISLVGDAALQLKATTGGGLVSGLRCAKILAENLGLGHYEKTSKKIKNQLKLHLKIRKLLDKCNDSDYDFLLSSIDDSRIKKLFVVESRERPLKLLISLVIRQPMLAVFGLRLLMRDEQILPD